MSLQADGIPLEAMQEPIPDVLGDFTTVSGIRFDIDGAVKIKPVEGKPNWGRSRTIIELGDQAVEFYLIVMANGNGTGDEASGHNLADVTSTGTYPRETLIVPRDKHVQAEAHLALATFDEGGNATAHAGCVDLVGFKPGTNDSELTLLGWLGQVPGQFWNIVRRETPGSPEPTTTYTVLRGPEGDFGTTHSVYNPRLLQMVGFVAIPYGQSTEILRRLGAKLPYATKLG